MSDPEIVVSPALGAWLALRRLGRGRVMIVGGVLLDGGRPLPRYLIAPVRQLLVDGHAWLEDTHVYRTEAGRELYRELCRVRGCRE